MSHIFISYSHQNSSYVQTLAASLTKEGYPVWLDEAIPTGDRWFSTIAKAIRDSAAVVVVMTPQAEESEWVEREIMLAQEEKKPIFPLLLSGKRFAILITTQYVDVREGQLPQPSFYKMLENVAPKNTTKSGLPEVGKESPAPDLKQSDNHDRIKVLIVDDHAMLRKGSIVMFMSYDDLELVGEAGDGRAAIMLCDQYHPDVVLMDMMMPIMDGITATRIIRQDFPDIQVIAFTSFGEEKLIKDVLEAGAISYLFKKASADDLVNAIRAAHNGISTFAPEVTDVLVRSIRQPHSMFKNLTPREQEVLSLMVKGIGNNEIATELAISRATTKNHVSRIIAKLGAATRMEAIGMVLDHNIKLGAFYIS